MSKIIKHNWTKEADDIIRKHFRDKTYSELIAMIGIPFSASAVRVRYSYLKVKTPTYAQVHTHYTEADERFIVENYKQMKAVGLAAHFGVNVSSMNKKITLLRNTIDNAAELLPKHINKQKGLDVGTKRERLDKRTGKTFTVLKTEKGWKRIVTRQFRPKDEIKIRQPRTIKYTDEVRDYCIKHVPVRGIKAVAEELGFNHRHLHSKIYDWRKSGYDIVIKRVKKVPKPKVKKPKITSAVKSRTGGKPAPKPKEINLHADISNKISVRVNSKTIVFVRPGTDIEAIKAKYAS